MLSDTVLLCLLAIPGAGKTHSLLLLRDFFETCLEWTHGFQFQYLATQNTMAELVRGNTVHTWGCIPANKAAAAAKAQASNKDADWDKLFENALSLRWLVITGAPTLLRAHAASRHID